MNTRITEEMVFKAANEIDMEGKTPRVPDIRTKLGSGSYSTIQTHLKKWKETQQVEELEIKEDAPEAIKSRLEAFTTQIWNIALEMANERLRGEREALEEIKKEMEEQQKETAETADQLADEIEVIKELLKETNALLEIEKQSHEATRQMLQFEVDQTMKLTVQVESNTRHINDLKESEKESRTLLEETIKDYKLEINKIKAENANLSKINMDMKYELQNYKEDNNELAEKIKKTENEHRITKENEKAIRIDIQTAQVEKAILEGEIKSLKEQLEKNNKMIADSLKIVPSKNNNKPKTTDPSQ